MWLCPAICSLRGVFQLEPHESDFCRAAAVPELRMDGGAFKSELGECNLAWRFAVLELRFFVQPEPGECGFPGCCRPELGECSFSGCLQTSSFGCSCNGECGFAWQLAVPWAWDNTSTRAGDFNQSLRGVQLPSALQMSILRRVLSRSLRGTQFPGTLQMLTFGHDLNQSLEGIQLPRPATLRGPCTALLTFASNP